MVAAFPSPDYYERNVPTPYRTIPPLVKMKE
jgi:hypothetical protein